MLIGYEEDEDNIEKTIKKIKKKVGSLPLSLMKAR